MEEERDQKELKHVCRLCDKRYPSGKSLGGHMRSHVIANNNSYLSAHKTKFNPSSKKISILDQDAGETTVFKKDSPTAGVVENFGDGSCSGGSNGGGDGPNGGGQHSGYGLRENPKKTWRMVDSNITVKQERVCKQCGKSFQSLKALCGHMSSHSDKERNFHNRSWKDHVEDDDDDDDESNDDDDDDGESWAYGDDEEEEEDEEEEDKLVEELAAMDDSQSDNNVVEPESIIRQQNQHHLVKVRSKSKPKTVSYDQHDYFKHKNASVDSLSLANNGNSSSNNSEIEQDQEEIAMCLMMLSRDKSNYHKHHHQKGGGKETRSGGGINLTAESSDNNSVILEGGSSSTHIGSAKRKYLDSISNACGVNKNSTNIMKLKQHQKQQQQQGGGSSKLKPEMNVEIDNSDSGYFENGAKELESDGSVDGFTRNYKKPKLEFTTAGSGSSNKGKSAALVNYYFSEEYNYHDASGSNGSEIKHDSRNRKRNGSQVEARTTAHFPAPQRGINGRYECTVCNKSFKTHQALGGHIITHRKPRHPDTTTGNGGSSSIVPKSSASKSEKKSATTTITTKKTKSHKCPFCPKIFRSGQALGGHKRSHLIGAGAVALLEKAAAASSSPRVPSSPKVEVEEEEEEEEEEEKPPLLDLNLPAPMEDEGGNGNGERIAAW